MSEITNSRIKVEEARPRKEGDNWIGTLKLHGIVSGFLAFVSVILIVCVSITSSRNLYFSGNGVILILVVSFFLFILSAELYISAISFDVFSISEDIKESLKKVCEAEKLDWEDYIKKQLVICKKKKRQAKIVSNIALLLLFITFLLITPYGYGYFILFAGIGYLIWQLLMNRR